VFDKETFEALIIDPGDDADYITRILSDEKLKPTKIIATHGHFDHLMAATELQLAYNIPFLIHEKDKFLVKRLNETARYFTGVKAGPPPKINKYLKKGEKIKLGDLSFKIIETPGHTPGSLSLYSRKEKLAFVGDLIFANGGVGRTDFSYSKTIDLQASVNKILKLPKDTMILAGHGPGTTVAEERRFHRV
jgi:glyoxylase-like metal-dependent hydrolase (beta-lactamase superfamily II)